MNWYVEKEFYDSADDIEAVNIHYVCTPLGSAPDWERQRVTRYMPVARSTSQTNGHGRPTSLAPGPYTPPNNRLRKKVLKFPSHLSGSENGNGSTCYHLHYYFEIFQDGHRRFSPLHTEEVMPNGQEGVEAPA